MIACQGLNLLMAKSLKELISFGNSNFLILISLQPNGLNLVKWIVSNSKGYAIRLQIYNDQE